MAGFVEFASVAGVGGLLVVAVIRELRERKQHGKASDEAWESTQASAFLKAHPPSAGHAGPRAQEQFAFDAEIEGAQYAAAGEAGPCASLAFPDGSRLYCLDESRCHWVRERDIPTTTRLRRFLRGAPSTVPVGELAFLAVAVVVLVGLAAWGINEAVQGMFVDLEQRMREAAGSTPPAERRP